MKLRKRTASFVSFSALAGLLFFVTGCARDPDISDEFARIASQEVANMDANASMGITGGLSKSTAAAADTINNDLIIHPYSWDAASGGYVRTAVLTCSDGYERTRIDTLTFYGNAGTLQYPTLATVDSVHHVRHVSRSRGGNQLNVAVDMHSTIMMSGGVYTHVKNGTMVGTFDGEQVATGAIVNVTRIYSPLTHWQLWPASGSVTADFPRRLFEVEFLGAGLVRLTVTNKATDRTRVVTISVDQQ
jgi:hypothetical protein